MLNPPPKSAPKDDGGAGSASDSGASDSEKEEEKGLMGTSAAGSTRRQSTGDGFSDEETLVGSAAPSLKEASLGRKGSRRSGRGKMGGRRDSKK